MISKRKYFIITWGVLVSIISIAPFVRPHQVLNNSTVVVESNKVEGENTNIQSETPSDIAVVYSKDADEFIVVNSLQDSNKLRSNQELSISDAKEPLTVKDNNDNKPVVKAEGTQKPLSRGGSISNVIKASSTKMEWPLRGSITSPFGVRARDNHPGIDIAASIGTPIKAASDGKVVFAGWQDGYGNLLIIQASSGLQTYYAHTSKILVNEGQTVSTGQVVAKVGMTGRTTGPHLHFEVRKNGNPVNPLSYLS